MNNVYNQHRPIPMILIALAVLLVGGSCSRPSPTETAPTSTSIAQPITLPTRTQTNTPKPGETQPPPALALVETTAVSAPSGITATVSASLTPTPCKAPAGWIVYTILPGDTLYSLAQNTGSTVEEIKAANCMSSDLIKAYDEIHLRKRPPAPPPAPVVPPQPSEDPCASIFSCQNPDLPSLALAGGGGNVETIDPCNDNQTGPRIDHSDRSAQTVERLVGFPAYFYACGFSDPDHLIATLTGPGRYDLKAEAYDVLPPGTITNDNDKSARLFPWYPICNVPVGPYTLIINNPDETEKATLEINLEQASYPTILVIPDSLKPGSQFDIYYCGYSAQANQSIQFDLHEKTDQKNELGLPIYNWIRTWPIDINEQGWAHQTQILPSEARSNLYHIADDPRQLDGEVYFWVIR